ncbi:hypothetical protein [Lacipirellula parvula]|uniref:Peptide chain release factor 1 n=1 Tax=Lacipirellula parvula TaxID=2650471 RepID=A0A5K7XDD7_9BACT|nr:hypothetical protein [Lacipirellula parvula]BBO34405.1 peptide chain release factor 1 [Lacipirellula parvula]
MAGIGSVGSTPNLFSYLKTSSEGATESALPEMPAVDVESLRQGALEDRLDQALSAAGVDEETANALKSDLQEAFDKAKSEGKLSDPESMKSTIDEIFAEHGLDAKEILGGKFGPQTLNEAVGPPKEGEDSRKTLLDLLNRMAKEGSSSADLSELLLDAVKGFDQTA